MKILETFVLLALIGLLGGCASEKRKRAEFFEPKEASATNAKAKRNQSEPPFTRAEAEIAICEAATRRFVRDASKQMKAPVKLVFVSFSPAKVDPDLAFLARFEDKDVRVAPMSSAVRSPEKGFADKETGDRGVVLRIERVDWVDFYTAQAACAWAPDASTERVFVYNLAWKKGNWTVQ